MTKEKESADLARRSRAKIVEGQRYSGIAIIPEARRWLYAQLRQATKKLESAGLDEIAAASTRVETIIEEGARMGLWSK